MTGKDNMAGRDTGKKTVYERTWRNKFLTTHVTTFDEMIDTLQEAVNQLRAMRAAGVTLDDNGGIEDDHANFRTTDPGVAEEFGFVETMWHEDDECEDDEFKDDEFEDDEFEDDEESEDEGEEGGQPG